MAIHSIRRPFNWPTGGKPPAVYGLTAAVVADNCARLGLPVPVTLCDGATGVDVMSGRQGALGAGGSLGALPQGLGVRGDGTSAAKWNWAGYAPIKTSNGAGTADFTVAVFGAPSADTVMRMQFGQGASSSARFYLAANLAAAGTASSGRFAFFISTTEGVSAASRVNGSGHLWAGRRYGTTVELWEDGVFLGTDEGANATIYGGTQSVSLGGSPYDATNRSSLSPVLFGAGWDSALSAAQMLVLGTRWAEIFTPAPRRLWFDLGAGGGTTVSIGAYALPWVGLTALGNRRAAPSAVAVPWVGQAAQANRVPKPGTSSTLWTGGSVSATSGRVLGAAALQWIGQAVAKSTTAQVGARAVRWVGRQVTVAGAVVARIVGILGSSFRRLIG